MADLLVTDPPGTGVRVVVIELPHGGGNVSMAGGKCQQGPDVADVLVVEGKNVIRLVRDSCVRRGEHREQVVQHMAWQASRLPSRLGVGWSAGSA